MRSVRVTTRETGTVRGTARSATLFSRHYLRNRSTLDIGVLGYIGVLFVRNILLKSGTFPPPPGTPCIK